MVDAGGEWGGCPEKREEVPPEEQRTGGGGGYGATTVERSRAGLRLRVDRWVVRDPAGAITPRPAVRLGNPPRKAAATAAKSRRFVRREVEGSWREW